MCYYLNVHFQGQRVNLSKILSLHVSIYRISSLFCNVTQHVSVVAEVSEQPISYIFKQSSCPETSLNNYHIPLLVPSLAYIHSSQTTPTLTVMPPNYGISLAKRSAG
jgi:hypothetical protein